MLSLHHYYFENELVAAVAVLCHFKFRLQVRYREDVCFSIRMEPDGSITSNITHQGHGGNARISMNLEVC